MAPYTDVTQQDSLICIYKGSLLYNRYRIVPHGKHVFKVNDTCIWHEELKVQRLMFVYCAKKGYLISNNDENSRRQLPSINTYRWQYVGKHSLPFNKRIHKSVRNNRFALSRTLF